MPTNRELKTLALKTLVPENRPEFKDGPGQLEFFSAALAVVHYFDKDGALHSGRLVRKIKKGKKRGSFVVADAGGKILVPGKIRNIEFPGKPPSGSP
jgi:hypothetical protein